ncbi:HOOK-domain-containing protein [Lentinula edodes]|uniref:HOOK-domain-containing protein n=1 Tax=Lentinula edodes TaxID=5353 RepID=A0A1Q3DYA1_LENED|nr:HOOK-domain-containing protein [Lentinula edodes]
MMSDSKRKEIDAFFNFFAAFDLTIPVATLADLSDGQALFEVLAVVDPDYFRPTTRFSAQDSANWVLHFSSLKRLYRLMTQYFSDVLQKPTSGLDVPDLQAMAKNADDTATLVMCRLTIAIGVQCEKNKEFIDKIQGLSQVDQHYLMKVIEQVMSRISTSNSSDIGEASMTEDDHYYRIQLEKSAILNEKETLEKVYQTLLDEHRQLQTTHDDILSERGDLVAQLKEARREVDNRRNDGRADVMLRAEIDRLRADLQKSEDNLAIAESELEKQTAVVTDLTRKTDDLQSKADEAAKLKDQLDEYRHYSEKLNKVENVLEKYKKKLQEAAELRQRVKTLEKQNADLVDVNASIEEEYRKVAAFKPLMESYKGQIVDLENKASTRTQELETLKFELEQALTKLKIVSEERVKESETIELYQERVRELELASDTRLPKAPRTRQDSVETTDASGEPLSSAVEDVDDEEDAQAMGLGGELHDAESGTTMTDLKLQIRKLKRELEAVRKNEADASRVLVLENLLDDANRMKSRYEADYLAAHREKLVLQRDLEEIRSGKSMGDGAEAAIALRQRLNESVDQLDAIRKEHAELEVKFETQSKELTIAKSDLTLVNKDQLDILASLRDSVNEDKAGLEADLERLQKQNKDLVEKNRMQLEQVNVLLLEKVNLQSEGIGQREKMLQRERDFGDLRASLSGKDLPEDIKQRLLALHEDNVMLKESLKTSNEKLTKAKTFIKNQDKLYREEQAGKGIANASGIFEEAEVSMRSQIKILEDELERQKVLLAETKKRYMREAELLMSYIHSMGMNTMRSQLGQRPGKTAWLTSQRNNSRLQRTI